MDWRTPRKMDVPDYRRECFMRMAKKFGLGCGILLLLLVAAGVSMWFLTPGPPGITVDDPGEGGIRTTLNDRPANFFPGRGNGPRPAILMLGGSEGGLHEGHNAMARRLAAQGFAVIYPGYYRTSDDTKSFDMVPLETFDTAIAYMQARDDVDASRIGAMGVSKGAEGVLLYASRNPAIKAVVAIVPSNVVWQGFDWESTDMSQFRSSWSVDGEAVPYARYEQLEWYEWFTGEGIGTMYSDSLDAVREDSSAPIAVEAISGPVLLLCGKADALWPSCRMSRELVARAQSAGKTNIEIVSYDDGGHMIYGRPREPGEADIDQLDQMGGTAEGNNDARMDGLKRIDVFFADSLGAATR